MQRGRMKMMQSARLPSAGRRVSRSTGYRSLEPSLSDSVPLVGAAIVGHNDREWLPSCLDALERSTYDRLCIMYVDNASRDDSARVVRLGWPEVRVVRLERNIGFCGGNSIAILELDQYGGDFFFLVNPDVRCLQTW